MKNRFILLLATVAMVVFGFACNSEAVKSSSDPTVEPDPNTEPPNQSNVEPGSSSGDPTPAKDAGTDTGSDADADVTPKEPTNQAECIAACEATHPTAAADNHELDNLCFFGAACGNVCNNLGQGESKYPDGTAAASCNTAAAGSYPIGTPSQACSNCLASTPACCDLWIKIFGSAEGQSLSACAHDCWSTFPN